MAGDSVTFRHLDLSLNVISSERVSVTLKSTIATPFSHSCIPLDLSEEPYFRMFSLLVGLLASVCITESPPLRHTGSCMDEAC